MLFGAGMGIGLLFYGVAEPVLHFLHPSVPVEGNISLIKEAMSTTFYHWGVHTWGIYSMVALAIAFSSYNLNKKFVLSGILDSLTKSAKVNKLIQIFVDLVAMLATFFGLAITLGYGAQQINSGLNYLFGVPIDSGISAVLIFVLTGFAILSVVLGMDKGVKRLSEFNLILAASLLLFVFLVGPKAFIMDSLVQNTGHYLEEFIHFSTWTEAYQDRDWQNDLDYFLFIMVDFLVSICRYVYC